MTDAVIKVIVFDFDGVFVDSNQLKHDAFFSLFGQEDGVSPELIQEAIDTGGSRFEVFRYIFSHAGIGLVQLEERVERYASLYNDEVQKGIIGHGLYGDTREALTALAKIYPLYLNSGTPEVRLKETAQALAIDQLFRGIYGTPASKENNLVAVMKAENIAPHDMLFVGDGAEDAAAAQVVGCKFVGIANKWNGWKDTPFPILTNAALLPSFLGTAKAGL